MNDMQQLMKSLTTFTKSCRHFVLISMIKKISLCATSVVRWKSKFEKIFLFRQQTLKSILLFGLMKSHAISP